MPLIISLLRGINVGAHHRIKMPALLAIYESLGLRNAISHLQSGNVIFTAPASKLPGLPAHIESAIEKSAGFRPSIILRTPDELSAALAKNPFAKRPDLDPARLLITFFANEPIPAAAAKVAALHHSPEEIALRGREMFIYFPNGAGRAKLPTAVSDKSLGSPGTARNLNTVLKLLELARSSVSS